MSRPRALAALVLGSLSLAAGSAAALTSEALASVTRDHSPEHTVVQWVLPVLDELSRRLIGPLAYPEAHGAPSAEASAA